MQIDDARYFRNGSSGRASVEQTVKITPNALQVLLSHAYTTEGEEIIGLLLGDVIDLGQGRRCTRIYRVRPQVRVDRRHDRVEVAEAGLLACQNEAELQQEHSGVACRVVGWYHSHPRLAVIPSIVDLRYQDGFQLLDAGFVGLIASVFNEQHMTGKVQLTAFQSSGGISGRVRFNGNNSSGSSGGASSGCDSSGGSNGNTKGGGDGLSVHWERISIEIENFTPLPKLPPNQLSDELLVQRVIFDEEHQMYCKWRDRASSRGPAAMLLSSSAYQQILLRILETVLRPSRSSAATRLAQARAQTAQVQEQIAELKEELKRRTLIHNNSHHHHHHHHHHNNNTSSNSHNHRNDALLNCNGGGNAVQRNAFSVLNCNGGGNAVQRNASSVLNSNGGGNAVPLSNSASYAVQQNVAGTLPNNCIGGNAVPMAGPTTQEAVALGKLPERVPQSEEKIGNGGASRGGNEGLGPGSESLTRTGSHRGGAVSFSGFEGREAAAGDVITERRNHGQSSTSRVPTCFIPPHSTPSAPSARSTPSTRSVPLDPSEAFASLAMAASTPTLAPTSVGNYSSAPFLPTSTAAVMTAMASTATASTATASTATSRTAIAPGLPSVPQYQNWNAPPPPPYVSAPPQSPYVSAPSQSPYASAPSQPSFVAAGFTPSAGYYNPASSSTSPAGYCTASQCSSSVSHDNLEDYSPFH